MADGDFIGIDVQGLDEVRALLKRIPPEAQAQLTQDVSEYLVKVFKAYPSYRYIRRAEAYPDAPAGPGWFSDRQRRYVMMKIRQGEMDTPYRRTQQLARGWRIEGQGTRAIVVNETPYAVHVMGDGTQSRHEGRVGWRQLTITIRERMGRIIEIANAAVKTAIKRLDKAAQ